MSVNNRVAKPVVYFEPPSRLQLLDKLKHLVRFSDFLLLISSESGMGKTTLSSQLQPDASDATLFCCTLDLQTKVDQAELLGMLMAQLPSHEDASTDFAAQLNIFHRQLKALQGSGQKCLILIDNAENLLPASLNLLLNLHAAESGNAQLLFLSSTKFANQLLKHDQVIHMEGRVHHLELERMTDEEVAEYLSVCHPTQALTDKQIDQIKSLSGGVPEKIEQLLKGKKVTAATSSVTAFPLPGLHMLGIGLVLFSIVMLSLWKFLPEDLSVDASTEDKARVSLPLNVQVEPSVGDGVEKTISSVPAVEVIKPVVVETKVSELKSILDARLKEQEQKIQAKQSPDITLAPEAEPVVAVKTDTTETLKQDFKEVIAKNKPVAQIKDIPPATPAPVLKPIVKKEPVLVVEAARNSIKGGAGEEALLTWPSSGYTLQMLGARSKESAVEFIKSQKSPENFLYFSTVYKGKPWFVVVYGQYANRDVANAEIRRLPESLKKVKPWARSVQGVQVDIRKKNSN